MNDQTCHDYGAACEFCHGEGIATEAQAIMLEFCPLAPSFTFPLGREGLRIAKANERVLAAQRAAQVKPLRISRRISQKELGRLTGIGRSTIAMMETGQATCSADLLQLIRDKGKR